MAGCGWLKASELFLNCSQIKSLAIGRFTASASQYYWLLLPCITRFIFVGYTTQKASLNISGADICIRHSFLSSTSMSGCGILFYNTPGPLNKQLMLEIRAMQDTNTDAAVTCVDLAKVKNSTCLEIYDIRRDEKFLNILLRLSPSITPTVSWKLLLVH